MFLQAVSAKCPRADRQNKKEQHDGKDFFIFRRTDAQQLDDLDRRSLSFSFAHTQTGAPCWAPFCFMGVNRFLAGRALYSCA
jgi:hypothetical protein